jgi:hypothetical protein
LSSNWDHTVSIVIVRNERLTIVLASSMVELNIFNKYFSNTHSKTRSGQSKDRKIGICCFSAKHAALRRKSKDWLAWNQDNVSVLSDMT